MKITILQSIAGHAEPMYGLPDFGFRPGETIDVDAALGAAWVKSGIAKKADAKKPIGRGAVPAVRAGSVTAPAGSIDVETSIADGEESAENGKDGE